MTTSTLTRPIRLSDHSRPRRQLAVGNIPIEVNTFVGRDRELARLREVQAHARLLTLVGPGGVGKTRLALRLEAVVRDAYADGSWLVDLTPVVDPDLVPQALGDVLGVQRQPGQQWLGELTRVLRHRSILLVLDNCEHLVNACADLVEGLLRACGDLRLLATSQQPLGVSGEIIWRVPPLAVPAPTENGVSALRSNDASRLFVERARAHQPDFTLSTQNAPLVAEICRQLDGLPLALELVAARVASLGVAETAARLDDRFKLAVGHSRTAPARRQTLQAALEWSWSLLSQDEMTLLRRLSVFVDGWTLQAAEAVCGNEEPLAGASVVDTLDRLVARSLVVADHGELTVRYRLLESVRAYASAQLQTAAETPTLQRRHAQYMLGLAERSHPEGFDTPHFALLKPEEDNVRAAFQWAVQEGDAELGLRLATGAFRLWLSVGHYHEGSTWFERVLALPSAASAAARATALTIHAQLLVLLGEFAAAETHGQAALEAQLVSGDTRGIGLAHIVLGNTALQRGDLEQAASRHAVGAPLLREAGSQGYESSLTQSALIACELGDIDRARWLIAEVEDIARARHEPLATATVASLRGLVALAEGDAASAAPYFEQSLLVLRAGGDQQSIVKMLTSLGHVRLDLGQARAAFQAFTEAVHDARASGERVRVIRALEGCARYLADADIDAAVRLAGATDRARASLGAAPWPIERRYLEAWLARARRVLGPSAYTHAWEDGHASSLDQAISMAEAFRIEPDSSPSAAHVLSPREREVAILLARGLTNKQVAAELVVSPATVRSHVEHVLAKLDLRSRAQIGVWASQHGLLASHESD